MNAAVDFRMPLRRLWYAKQSVDFGIQALQRTALSKNVKENLRIIIRKCRLGFFPDAVRNECIHFATGEIRKHATGGMSSKLQAVKLAVDAGIETLIANGRNPGQLLDLVNNTGKATRFLPN